MKRYKLKPDSFDYTGEKRGVYPRMMASEVESKEVLDRSKDYFSQFYPQDVSFKGMFPSYGYDRPEPHAICDMHSWTESKPPALVYPVSPRFHDILIQFHLPEVRFYNGSVVWRGMEHPYYVMHLLTRQYQYIDFQYSTFIKSNYEGNKDTDAPIVQGASMEELRKKYSPQSFTFERAVMRPEFRDLDMCHIIIHGIIISKRLKESIEVAHLTGVRIEECPVEFEFSDEL